MGEPIDPHDEEAVEAELAVLARDNPLVHAVLRTRPDVARAVGHWRATRWAIAVIARAYHDATEELANYASREARVVVVQAIAPERGDRA